MRGKISALILFALSCCSSPAFAWQVQMIGFGAASGAAPSYLVSESFDTTPGYDLTWTESAGAPNPDYTPALNGTQSLYLGGQDNALTQTAYTSFTPTAGQPQEAYFLLKVAALPSTGSKSCAIFNATTAARVTYAIKSTGQLTVQTSGGTLATTVGAMSVGTVYHVWLHYAKGTGANAVGTIAFSTDGVRPTTGNGYAASTDGTSTDDTNRVMLTAMYSTGTGINLIIDKFRVDDATIGDNPQ